MIFIKNNLIWWKDWGGLVVAARFVNKFLEEKEGLKAKSC